MVSGEVVKAQVFHVHGFVHVEHTRGDAGMRQEVSAALCNRYQRTGKVNSLISQATSELLVTVEQV